MSYEPPQQILRWANLPECESPAEGWQVQRFTDIAKVIAGQSPPSETYNEKGDGLPFLQGNADFSFKHPTPKLWCNSPAKIAKTGDTLISVRAPVGEINRADQDYAIGRGLAAIRATNVNPDFIYQGLQRWCWSLQRVAQGTTFDAITARHFSQLRVAIPENIDEQAAIARILDAVDTAIERTREAVEQVRLLRRSIMQEMLPPWIGFKHLRTDQLPPGVDCIENAKDVTEICNGSTPSREEGRYWRNGTIPWLPTGKVNDRIITSANEFVTESALRECSIAILPRGTVLVGMIGQGKTRGMTAYLDMESCINQNFGAYVPRLKIYGKWLFYYLDYHYARLREIGGGTNQGALNCFLLKRIKLPLPSLSRQQEVAALLDAVENLEHRYQVVFQQQQKLKKSLMHDLLTGKVRIGDSGLSPLP